MTSALVIMANGAEDIETISVTDILSRGGIKVTVAAVSDTSTEIKTAHGLTVKADILLKDAADNYDVVVVPGGYEGSMNCRKSELVGNILNTQKERGALIAAICAAQHCCYRIPGNNQRHSRNLRQGCSHRPSK